MLNTLSLCNCRCIYEFVIWLLNTGIHLKWQWHLISTFVVKEKFKQIELLCGYRIFWSTKMPLMKFTSVLGDPFECILISSGNGNHFSYPLWIQDISFYDWMWLMQIILSACFLVWRFSVIQVIACQSKITSRCTLLHYKKTRISPFLTGSDYR